MGVDLIAEFFECGPLQYAHIEQLTSAGVPIGALAPLARDFVIVLGAHFEFRRYAKAQSEEAVPAYILLCHDADGEAVDLAAWKPGAFIATWRGAAGMLGEEQVFQPRFGDPLLIHPTALEWMRARRDGVVVLDPIRAGPLLRLTGKLSVASMEQGQALRASLVVPLPEIVIRLERAAA